MTRFGRGRLHVGPSIKMRQHDRQFTPNNLISKSNKVKPETPDTIDLEARLRLSHVLVAQVLSPQQPRDDGTSISRALSRWPCPQAVWHTTSAIRSLRGKLFGSPAHTNEPSSTTPALSGCPTDLDPGSPAPMVIRQMNARNTPRVARRHYRLSHPSRTC